MYCLINVEQEGKFLSIYFSFIFSFWFFALGSGCTIYISDIRKFYPAIVPSLCVSAKFRVPPKKKEKKTGADRSVWGLVSSRPHRLIVTSTESRLYLLSCIGKGPVLVLIWGNTNSSPGHFSLARLQSQGKAPWVRGWSKSHYALGWRKHVKNGN